MNALNYRSKQVSLNSMITDHARSLEDLGSKESEMIEKVKQTMEYASNRLKRAERSEEKLRPMQSIETVIQSRRLGNNSQMQSGAH